MRGFISRTVLPRIADAVRKVALFSGLNSEQLNRLAGVCTVKAFAPGAVIFREGQKGKGLYVLLEGEASVQVGSYPVPVGTVGPGECLGEMALLTSASHSATATVLSPVETAVLGYQDLVELARLRTDIGLLIYKNLASGLGEKQKRSDLSLAHHS